MSWLRLTLFTFLYHFKWFRRSWGGHWEKWDMRQPITYTAWFALPECSKDNHRAKPRGFELRWRCEDYQ